MKLLISCRDAGAAFHIVEIIRHGRRDGRFDIDIVTQEPAYSIFKNAGFDSRLVDLPIAKTQEGPEANALLAFAERLLNENNYDAVLSGLSTHVDGGIDEAIIARTNLPTFVMQDFWGSVNSFFGKSADWYLCIDEDAAQMTKLKHGCATQVVGAPRYASYADVDFGEMKRRARKEIGTPASRVVIGYFGQPLGFLPGYRDMLEMFAVKLVGLPIEFDFLYRHHPRESVREIDETRQLFTNASFSSMKENADFSVEESLVCCDVVCSPFSLCLFDALFINYFSAQPACMPIAVLCEDSVAKYYNAELGSSVTVRPSIIKSIDTIENIGDTQSIVIKSLDPVQRRAVWAASKQLPPVNEAARKVVEILYGAGSAQRDIDV